MTMLTLCSTKKGSSARRLCEEGKIFQTTGHFVPEAFSSLLFINFNLNNRIINLFHN